MFCSSAIDSHVDPNISIQSEESSSSNQYAANNDSRRRSLVGCCSLTAAEAFQSRIYCRFFYGQFASSLLAFVLGRMNQRRWDSNPVCARSLCSGPPGAAGLCILRGPGEARPSPLDSIACQADSRSQFHRGGRRVQTSAVPANHSTCVSRVR